MRRRLAPLEQIEAFVVAAASPSFRAAADSLALSPAAFSRRIQAFSDYVGVKLFERSAGCARLTEAGRECLNELEPAYLELLRATSSIGRRKGGNLQVRLSLSHSLAVGWLIPRLNRFHLSHPDVDLSFKTERRATDVRRGDVDIAICYSDIDLSGLEVEPLFNVTGTPVAAPSVARAFRAEGRRLEHHRLLTVTDPKDVWPWWAEATGISVDVEPAGRFDMLHAMYESASHGAGIALGASPTVWSHIQSGRLEPLGLPVARSDEGYLLAAKPDRIGRRPVAAAWRWLKKEANRTPSFLEATPSVPAEEVLS